MRPSDYVVGAWNEVQDMRRAKHLREWLGITRKDFESRGAAWLEWAEQFHRMDQGNTDPEEGDDG